MPATAKLSYVICLFQRVSFFPVATFENCTLAIYQLTMSRKFFTFTPDMEKIPLLDLKYSEAVIEDSIIEDNTQVYCFWIFDGTTTLVI